MGRGVLPGEACYLHLVTVGTSILRNALLAARREGRDDVAGVLGACADPASLDEARCERELRPGTPAWDYAAAYLAADPYRASAELNAMKHFLDYGGGECRRSLIDKVILYHSETHAGEAAARILASFLRDACGVEAEVRAVPGLGVHERFWEGVAYLAKEIICTSRRAAAEGCVVLANATGGFKPEAGVVMAAASLGRVSGVYYIHEAAREPVYLPVIPAAPRPEASGTLRQILEAYRRQGKLEFTMEEVRPFAWVLPIAERLGHARQVAPGRYRFTPRGLADFARYVEWLVDPECA